MDRPTDRPTTDPRAAAYCAALEASPTPAHVDELRRRGLRIPATQAEASRLLTADLRREAVRP